MKLKSSLEQAIASWEDDAAVSLGGLLLAGHRREPTSASRAVKSALSDARYVVEAFDAAAAQALLRVSGGRNLAEAIEELRGSLTDVGSRGIGGASW